MAKRQTDRPASGEPGKSMHLHIRVGVEELQTWKYAAQLDAKPFSAWVRDAAWAQVNRAGK